MSRRIKDILRHDPRFKPDYAEQHALEERLFMFAKNRSLSRCTDGEFPAGYYDSNGVHPAFVLEEIGNYGFTCCPCTSGQKPGKSFIPEGTRTNPTGKTVPKTSYILHDIRFNPDDEFCDDVSSLGVIPEKGVVGDEYKGWKRR